METSADALATTKPCFQVRAHGWSATSERQCLWSPDWLCFFTKVYQKQISSPMPDIARTVEMVLSKELFRKAMAALSSNTGRYPHCITPAFPV